MTTRILDLAALTGLLVLGACGAPRTDTRKAAATDAAPPALTRFDWAPPCRVPVEERSTNDDESQRVRYVIEALPAPDGGMVVRLRDFVLLELNGEDMTTPEKQPLAPGLVVLTAAVPVLHVSAQGKLVATGPIEIDRLIGELGLAAEQAETVRRAAARRTSSPLDDRAAQRWRTWVGAWTAWSVAPGTSRDRSGQLESSTGALPVSEKLEHLGVHDGRARLRLSQTLDPAAVQKLHPYLFDSRLDLGLDPDEGKLVSAREHFTHFAELDAETLRPVRTRFEEELTIEWVLTRFDGRQTREVTWDWAHAQGCQR